MVTNSGKVEVRREVLSEQSKHRHEDKQVSLSGAGGQSGSSMALLARLVWWHCRTTSIEGSRSNKANLIRCAHGHLWLLSFLLVRY